MVCRTTCDASIDNRALADKTEGMTKLTVAGFTRSHSRLLTGLCCIIAGATAHATAPLDVLDTNEFYNPPISARPGAFWPWLNGHVSLPRLTHELEEMKAKGMSGADIWDVRANADPENMVPAGPAFLGPESLDAIAHAMREADRLGLRLGMIAASGWNAGGTWVTPPDAGMGLFHSEVQVTGPARFSQELPFPAVPAACPKDSSGRPVYWTNVAVLALASATPAPAVAQRAVQDLSPHLQPTGRLDWEVPPGQWSILRFVMANTGHQLIVPSPKSGGPMIDFLNPESTRMHFQYIVDRLESRVGDLRKSSLKYLEVDSMELGDELAWTGQILNEFRKQHRYEALPYLPVLIGRTVTSQEVSERFLFDWRKTVSDLFIESHYRGGRRLLNHHGLELCAEAGGPGAPIWDSCPVESLKALGTVDILRGEFWPKHRNMWLVKEVASAAHIYGKRIVDAESFTSWRHWQDGPYYLKQLADNALAEGLNHFTFHTFTHSPDEAGLPGYAYHAGTHINPNVAWWPMARPFIDYLARCSLLLQKGKFFADVCFYYGDHAPNFVPSKHAGFSPGQGYDYDVVNSDVILNRFKVRNRRLVLPDGMSYAVLVLPERNDMDLAVLQRLENLVRDGATVLGPKPVRTGTLAGYPERDRQVARLADKLWGKCDGTTVRENKFGKGRVIWNRPLAEVLTSLGLGQDFQYEGQDTRTRLDYLHRHSDGDEIYFVNNRNERWEQVDCVFRVKGKRPQLWHPETGAVRDLVLYEETEAGTRVPLHLAPAESVFLVFRPSGPRPHWTRLEPVLPRSDGIQPVLWSHSATPGGPMWLSDGKQEPAGQFITFDLGARRPLQRIRVWNYNENVRGYINYGVKELDILVSADDSSFRKTGSFTLRDGSENEDKNYSQDLNLQAAEARYVRFEVKSNHSRLDYLEGVSPRVGLSRVEFYAPEKVAGVRVHAVSSGQAFHPGTDENVGNLHPAAEIISRQGSGYLLRAWTEGPFVLRQPGGTFRRVEPGTIPPPLSIDGSWTVSFPPDRGAPESSLFDQLGSWTDRPEPGIKYFSGIAVYRKSFELPPSLLEDGMFLELDLGAVQHVARVTLNGKPLGILWKPPYAVDISAAARPGFNELAVEVANTWNNRLIGDAATPGGKRVASTNLQKRFAPDPRHLQPAGLLGPVRILYAKEVRVVP